MSPTILTRRHLLLAAPILLAGCAMGGAPPRKFSLRPLAPAAGADGPTWSLGVAAPRALKSLDSERIAHRPDSFELQYYAGADWVDRAPQMLQMLMIRSFQNRTRLQVTATEAPGPLPEFVLTSLLQDFQSEHGTAHVTLVASLARSTRRQTAETRTFEAGAPCGEAIESVVTGFDAAVAEMMQALIAWVLRTGELQRA
jgi:cholesterol transport system auxiliary component